MAVGNFPACNAFTRKEEGGYSNHPSDPGGKTMNGITEKTFHGWLKAQGKKLRDVRTITPAEVDAIYKGEYWDKARCDTLAFGVDLAVYDASVNSGVSRGRKWLMASIGGDDVTTIKKICKARLSFMKSLKIWETFKNGWSGRVARCEAAGIKMNLEKAGKRAGPVLAQVQEEAMTQKKKEDKRIGGTVVVGGGGAVGSDQIATAADAANYSGWVLFGVLVVSLAVIAVLVWRSRTQRNRVNAIRDTALGAA